MRSYLWNWQKWSIRDEQNYYKGKEKDTPDLLTNLAENNVRSVKVMSDESIVAGYINYLHKQKKDNKF